MPNKNNAKPIELSQESIGLLAEAIASRLAEELKPILFTAARVASRDTFRSPYRDERVLWRDCVKEANAAMAVADGEMC